MKSIVHIAFCVPSFNRVPSLLIALANSIKLRLFLCFYVYICGVSVCMRACVFLSISFSRLYIYVLNTLAVRSIKLTCVYICFVSLLITPSLFSWFSCEIHIFVNRSTVARIHGKFMIFWTEQHKYCVSVCCILCMCDSAVNTNARVDQETVCNKHTLYLLFVWHAKLTITSALSYHPALWASCIAAEHIFQML